MDLWEIKYGKVFSCMLYEQKPVNLYTISNVSTQNIKEIRFEYEIRKSKDGNVLRFFKKFILDGYVCVVYIKR